MNIKRLLTFLILTSSVFSLSAQDVNFENGTWQDVNQKAAITGKLIMVDAYTDWCGPCKQMDKVMFHDNPEVAELINENFISFKIDCERNFGIDFSRKFKVSGYPSLLFFNSEGQLIDRQLGYNPEQKEFLASIQEVIDLDPNDTYAYDARQIRMDWPDFYYKAFRDANDTTWQFPKDVDVASFLDEQNDLFSEISWAVMVRFELDEKTTNLFKENFGKYRKLYKKEATNKMQNILFQEVSNAGKNADEDAYKEALKDLELYMPDEYEELSFWMEKFYFRTAKDWNGYANQLNESIKDPNRNVSIEEVNDVAWTLYESCDDPVVLKMALGWFRPFLDNMDYYSADTYAALLFKTGNLDEAHGWANKAIEIGKADGYNTDGTTELLEMIEEKRGE